MFKGSTCGASPPHVRYVPRMMWKIATRMGGEISGKIDPAHYNYMYYIILAELQEAIGKSERVIVIGIGCHS